MNNTFEIDRQFAINSINFYYELKKEGNNDKNIIQFNKSFVKCIMSYAPLFIEEFADRLFKSIYTLEWSSEKNCENEYGFTSNEVRRLFLSMKNYLAINYIENINFNFGKSLNSTKEEYLLDIEYEYNNCVICQLEEEKRGNYYYSIPYNLNEPICHFCINKVENNYLSLNGLIKCDNCERIWDGCAQCNCLVDFTDEIEEPILETETEIYKDKIKIKEVEEELLERNLELQKENNMLKEKIKELVNCSKN
jgi:hypothetical protein